jgi:membrane dipeptidase
MSDQHSGTTRREWLRYVAAAGAVFALQPLQALAQSPAPQPHWFVDGHLDFGWNIVSYARDYSRSAYAIRREEAGSRTAALTGQATVGLPELQQAPVGLLFGTIYVMPRRYRASAVQRATYQNTEEAHAWGQQMLYAMRQLSDREPTYRIMRTPDDLSALVDRWTGSTTDKQQRNIGIVLAMEGADPIRTPDEIHTWHADGLRCVGLSWARTRYAGSDSEPAGLSDAGVALLENMRQLDMILDTAHLAEAAFWQAMQSWDGRTIYSHGNSRHYLPGERGLSDDQIDAICERDGVIGIGLYNGFFQRNLAVSGRPTITDVINSLDAICQRQGTARHVGLGTDLDGGFGAELIPTGLDTIADINQVPALLQGKGYDDAAIRAITHGNWLRMLA